MTTDSVEVTTREANSLPVNGMEEVSTKSGNRGLQLVVMVAHLTILVFVIIVVYCAVPGTSLFSWHPTLMALSFGFMAEAILMFSPESSVLGKTYKRKTKAQYHWVLQLCAISTSIAGVAVIVTNKTMSGYPHFMSWHSWLGIGAFGYIIVQGCCGVFLYYPGVFASTTPSQLKLYHATFGMLGFLCFCGAISLGLLTKWFQSNASPWMFYVCISCPIIMSLIVMNQVTSEYLQRKGGLPKVVVKTRMQQE